MIDPKITVGMFTTDADLVVRSWDDWLVHVTGILTETARGQPLTSLVPDLEKRRLLARFQRVVQDGVVEVLAPAFHHYLIECSPQETSKYFDSMQQHVTIAPLREDDQDRIVGVLVTVQDVTARREHERDLAEQMASSDEGARLRAVQTLSTDQTPDSEPAQALMDALGDKSWRVRRVAADGLAQRGGTETVAALLHAFRQEHRSLSVLNSALLALATSEADVLAQLVEFLHAPDVDLRTCAALALGDRRDPRAIPALLAALDEDADVNVRYHAIEALGKLWAGAAVESLASIVEAGDFFLAFLALDALTRIGDPQIAPRIVPTLADELLRPAAANALGQLGDDNAVLPLVMLLNTPPTQAGTPARIIALALAALHDRYQTLYREGGHIADLARDVITATGEKNLLDALADVPMTDTHDDKARALALVLGWLESDRVMHTLAQLVGRPGVQPDARQEAADALVHHGTRVTGLLLEQLDAENATWETRQTIIVALGRIGDVRALPALAKIGDPEALDALLVLLGHPDTVVRQAAIAAINSLGHPDMAARAVELLHDPEPRVRESAVKIAGYFGYPECVDLLFERCNDVDINV
ncbi:MAG: HEAT repeat domain-containing protein [Chloroflexi bacterium]|nr:HEAT repeat domain-containing protein [Chloroflexota bacterium]